MKTAITVICKDCDYDRNLNKNSKIRHFCEDYDHDRSANKESYKDLKT